VIIIIVIKKNCKPQVLPVIFLKEEGRKEGGERKKERKKERTKVVCEGE
jgi:hypothetical protein